MLKIFKNYTSKSSILDDFSYYEERQKSLQEEKARLNGKNYDCSSYIPAFVRPKKSSSVTDRPCIDEVGYMVNRSNSSGKTVEQVHVKLDVPNFFSSEEGCTKSKSDENGNGITAALKIGSLSVDEVLVKSIPAAAPTEANTVAVDVLKVGSKCCFANSSSSEEINTKQTSVEVENGGTDVSKIGILSKDGKLAAAVRVATANTVDVFTVGSMPVKVNGFSETSGVLAGSVPIVPKE